MAITSATIAKRIGALYADSRPTKGRLLDIFPQRRFSLQSLVSVCTAKNALLENEQEIPGVARGLKARHDHGSPYKSRDFQDEIKCLGIEASPSFVREPEGNGVAERTSHLNPQGEPAGGQDFQNHRGFALRARRVRHALHLQ